MPAAPPTAEPTTPPRPAPRGPPTAPPITAPAVPPAIVPPAAASNSALSTLSVALRSSIAALRDQSPTLARRAGKPQPAPGKGSGGLRRGDARLHGEECCTQRAGAGRLPPKARDSASRREGNRLG